MADTVDLTPAAYQGTVQRYVNASGPPDPALQAFLGRVAEAVPGGTVIEVVSGLGRDADHLESLGPPAQRTDATPTFVGRLRADGHDARPLNVRTDPRNARTEPLRGPYDAVLAQAVLLHLSREQLAAVANGHWPTYSAMGSWQPP